LERKLTAILCADVHGYSRLMGEDEAATLRTLSAYRKIIDTLIENHRGRFVNSAGDSVLAEFASVVEAVNCAVNIQAALKAENADLPPGRRMEFRMGVNSGDVMVEGEQIYGDGVNVAARLENLADPGGICISGTVHDQVRDKLALAYEDRGEQAVKNIVRPVHVWCVLLDGTGATHRLPRRSLRPSVFSLTGLAIALGIFVLVQHLSLKPPHTSASIPTPEKPALTLPSIPSIAVLPFANLSGDQQQEYFSDGISDQLINELSRLPGLFVIARNSSFAYKGKPIRERDLGRELGVKYVLEGTLRKAADQVRIGVALVDRRVRCKSLPKVLDLMPFTALQCTKCGDQARRCCVVEEEFQAASCSSYSIAVRTERFSTPDHFETRLIAKESATKLVVAPSSPMVERLSSSALSAR
jgi:adenylate cyclase